LQVPVSASRQLRYCYRFGRAQNALICVPTVDECTITAGAQIGGDARGIRSVAITQCEPKL
jgi:hypothetical protein